jgi:hypothetical protein
MTSNVPNRKLVRQAFAAKLESALVGSGKPAQRVYRYRPADFGGKYSVVAVTSAPTTRAKQAQVTRTANKIRLQVHTFVLYADKAVIASNNPAAGSSRVISVSNTDQFTVADQVTIEDNSHRETSIITAITPGVSIVVDSLDYSYTTPRVTWWSEEDAEDRMDWLEKAVADVVMDNDVIEIPDVGIWVVSFDGNSDIDFPIIGGLEYQHEIIPLVFEISSD